MQISQVMMKSYTQLNFDQTMYDEERCLSQFVSKMFDSLQYKNSNK